MRKRASITVFSALAFALVASFLMALLEAEIAALRNENGEAYRKCMQCRYAENAFGRLYITNQGDCYHKDLGCSGIKRTVRMIRLSEVGTRRPCSRCGQ